MNVLDTVIAINELSDEQEDNAIVLNFINDALARINIECDANYPSVDIEGEFELPEKWIRTLIIPFGVGRVKQRDSSQFEYSDAYREFLENLDEFKMKYEIPEEFMDESAHLDGYESDIYKNPALPWQRW